MSQTTNKGYRTGYLLKRFLPYFTKYKLILSTDLFCASLTTVCELTLPLIVKLITEKAAIKDGLTVNLILSVGMIYFVLRIIDAFANYYMQSMGHIMGAYIETDMRKDLFAHLQKLSFNYFDNHKIGQIMARITTDLNDVTEFAHHFPEEFFIAFFKITVSFLILCTMNIPLTLIVFAIMPFMILFAAKYNRKVKKQFKKTRGHIGDLNAQVEDTLLGVRVVKSFVNEEKEEEKFSVSNQVFLKIKSDTYRYMAAFSSTVRIFDGLMYIVVVVVGALFLLNNQIGAGEYIAYLLYVTTLLATVKRIVEFMEQFQRGITGVERFVEVMDAKVDIFDDADAQNVDVLKGEIEFNDVSFRYADHLEEVLSHVNIKIDAGKHVALVGPSGGGKTTICNLIQRFYDVTDGMIKVDGIDVKKIKLKSLRGHIGMVQQDVYLFSGTVLENIGYGKIGSSKEEIIEAAKLANAHDFIMQLEEGYDTYVGERGIKLSGGQKQRISIARVFLKNPAILVLDEATSALDNESERLVQNSLEKLAQGRTTFTVAHRLTTIKNADQILVLTDQGIEEMGVHSELIKKQGIYASLYQMYKETASF